MNELTGEGAVDLERGAEKSGRSGRVCGGGVAAGAAERSASLRRRSGGSARGSA